MTQKQIALLAAFGSAALLLGAFISQALGWAPCKMCLWQRWPHAAAVAVGGAVLLFGANRLLLALGSLSAFATAAIGVYHSGVELKLWQGPTSCTSSGAGLGGLSGSSLLPGGSEAPALVLCDTLTPFFLGLTMANYNAIFSVGLGLLWAWAATRD
jgi:disulfide bond formation protein DsbB